MQNSCIEAILDIEQSSYYLFEFKNRNNANEYETVFTSSGTMFTSNKVDDVGSITRSFSKAEKVENEINNQKYQDSIVIIKWIDSSGVTHSETIDLNVQSDIWMRKL